MQVCLARLSVMVCRASSMESFTRHYLRPLSRPNVAYVSRHLARWLNAGDPGKLTVRFTDWHNTFKFEYGFVTWLLKDRSLKEEFEMPNGEEDTLHTLILILTYCILLNWSVDVKVDDRMLSIADYRFAVEARTDDGLEEIISRLDRMMEGFDEKPL